MPKESSGPEGLPSETADLSWDELLEQSVPLTEDFLERIRELTEGVEVDPDEPFPEDYRLPWDQH
jgi:hypothetical protein